MRGTRSVATTSTGYSITVRAEAPPSVGATVAAAVMSAGGPLTALDVVESGPDRIVVDVTCDAADADHADQVTASIQDLPRVRVRKVSDRTFLLHLGGKIEVTRRCRCGTGTICPAPTPRGSPGCV